MTNLSFSCINFQEQQIEKVQSSEKELKQEVGRLQDLVKTTDEKLKEAEGKLQEAAKASDEERLKEMERSLEEAVEAGRRQEQEWQDKAKSWEFHTQQVTIAF